MSLFPRSKFVVMSGAATYAAYVKALAPALWFRLNELSGAVAVNSGSLGAAFDGAYTACTLAQQGKMSATGAVLFDGANSKIAVPAGAYANAAAQTAAVLINATSEGETNAGRFFEHDTQARLRITSAGLTLTATRNTAGSSISSTTLPLSVWRWLFLTRDLGGDGKQRIYVGASGAITEVAYTTQDAITALTDKSAVAMTIGNNPAQSATFAGLFDEFLLDTKVWTPAQMQQIVRLTGV